MCYSGNQSWSFRPINLEEYSVIYRNLTATHMQQGKQ